MFIYIVQSENKPATVLKGKQNSGEVFNGSNQKGKNTASPFDLRKKNEFRGLEGTDVPNSNEGMPTCSVWCLHHEDQNPTFQS